MSMEGSTIRVIRVDGMLLVGSVEGRKLVQPRAIMARPDGQLVLIPLVGAPKEAVIPDGVVSWEPEDEGLVRAYRENVSGLVMAKTMPENVVRMPGRP